MSSLYTQISQAVAEQRQQVAHTHPENKADAAQPPSAGRTHRAKLQPNRTDGPNGRTERLNGQVVAIDNGDVAAVESASAQNNVAERTNHQGSSLIAEMRNGVETDTRPTERYSFEIYTDQKEKIREIAYQYEKRTGKRLPKSRIIREALEHYFEQIFAAE